MLWQLPLNLASIVALKVRGSYSKQRLDQMGTGPMVNASKGYLYLAPPNPLPPVLSRTRPLPPAGLPLVSQEGHELCS